jgi:prepilin-type N-terminal cleavage/methylation domain-containing protein
MIKRRGFTLIELLVYMGIFSILLVVLTEMLVSTLKIQLDSAATGSVDQNNRFIEKRLSFDIQRAKSSQVSVDQQILTLNINGTNHIYTTNGDNFTLNGDELNGYDTTVSNLLFQKIGTVNSSIVINYGIRSDIVRSSGPEIRNVNTVINLRPNSLAALPPASPIPTVTSGPTSIPTNIPTPTQIPCLVTTSPTALNLLINGTGTVTINNISGQGSAHIHRLDFGSYYTNIATVDPLFDTTSPYSTTVRAIAPGISAVWATATLSDGRICQSTGTSDTDVTVTIPPSPTPTLTPANCQQACQQTGSSNWTCYQNSSSCNNGTVVGSRNQYCSRYCCCR